MMTKENRIGDPLEQVAQTGKLGRRSQTSKSPNFQNVETLNTQTVESPKVEQLKTPDLQNIEPPATQNSEMSKGQNVNSLAVQTSKGSHKGRTQKTIYLPPALAKRLNFASVEEEREISEIVTDALEDYFKKKAKENY